jgi:hypothetical protein
MKTAKIKGLILLMVFVLAVALNACSSGDAPKKASSDDSGNAPVEQTENSSSAEENSPEEGNSSTDITKTKELKTSKSGKIEVLESGYTYEGDSGVTAGVIIGNANSEKAFEF